MTDTQAIKDRLDIVQLIGEYVQLKKAGVNWKGKCPFHHEKTPSFMVHPEKQFWHCFGCGKGGDAFTFLQEMEGLDFPEALKILAERAGVKLDTFISEVNKSQKNRIVEINAKAAYFFHHFLLEMPAAQGARDYLQRRQLKPETIAEWQIGFIPEQWDLLTQYLLKKGNSIDDLLASGLTIKKEGVPDSAKATTGKGYYDRFRGRIMFPIWDAHGNIAGFTGRILVETEKSGGKYVNTPQTLMFDKSRILYGLNKAKTEIKNKDFTVLVEGQMDVVACHQAGMKNVVASSGTALTLEQIKLLKRYSPNIAIAFDADAAGQNAAKRGIDVALEQGMNIKIIQIPAGCGKDADECIKKDPAVWFKAVDSAKEVMDWYFAGTLIGANKQDPKQKQKIAETLLTEILRLPYAVERDHWLKKLAEEINVEPDSLRLEMRRLAAAVPKQHYDKAENTAASSQSQTNWQNQGKLQLLAENLLALFFKFPQILAGFIHRLKDGYFAPTSFTGLYENVKKYYTNKAEINSGADKETQNSIDILLLKADKDYGDFDAKAAEKEAKILLDGMETEWKKDERKKLHLTLKEAEAAKDVVGVQNILQQIMDLEN